ncbi:MAG: hypothetical protein RLZZ37_1069 [Actinomycetota bacterium]
MKKNRSKILNYFIFIVALFILFFVSRWFINDLDFEQVLDSVKNLNFFQVTLLILTAVFNIWIFQYPYLVTTKGLKYFQAFQVRNASFAISNCVPAGGTVGLAAQFAMLKSFGISNQSISTTVGIASVWNGLISYLMPILGLISLSFSTSLTPGLFNSTILGSLILICAVIMLFLIFKSESLAAKIGKVIDISVKPLNRLLKSKWNFSNILNDFRSEVLYIVKEKWLQITFSNLMVQFSMFLIFWASCYSMNIELSVFVLFASFCFGRFGTVIPFTPGGVGTTDVIMVSTLILYGANEVESFVAVLLWRTFYYLPQVLLGVVSYFQWQLNRSR